MNIISKDHKNFNISRLGDSISIEKSLINTPFGVIEVDSKTFSNISSLVKEGKIAYIFMKINFEIQKNFIPMKIVGVDHPGILPSSVGRIYQTKHSSLDVEFIIGYPGEGGVILDENEDPIKWGSGETYQIYYILLAVVTAYTPQDMLEYKSLKSKIKTVRTRDIKMNFGFSQSYFGLGQED